VFVDFTISPINFEKNINHGGILVLRDVTIEKERQEEVRFMSQHDYLTGLYNRYNFEQEMKRLNTERQLPISIIIGDVNGLKLLNDSFGHLEGDKLLKEVATIFNKATRSEDIVARWGGDEFTVLLPQTTTEDAHRVLDRISDLCDKSMYDIIKPSIAIGIATKTDKSQDILDILNAAEERMYNNKLVEGKKMREQLLENLITMVNRKALDNKSHSENISILVEKYSTYHKLQQQKDELLLLAKYHDIGKIAIVDEILNKPEELDDTEWSRIKAHPEIGSRIVSAVSDIQHISTDILHHHEWFDGTGYPQNLSGNTITLNARILSVLDAYESIVNDKVYREKRSHDEAITEILKGTGNQFDPEIVKLFIQIFEKDNQ